MVFRNLDGSEVVQHKPARVGTLRMTSTLERFAEGAGSIIVFFDVVCTQDDDVVMTMKTAFGFFSPEALKTQVGLRVKPDALAALSAEAPVTLPYRADELSGAPWLDEGRLQVIDRVNFWPGGGEAGLGRLVAEYDVHPEAWFFKAHFFQDPVQPGSLGLEAMQQAARAAARLVGIGRTATDTSSNPSLWTSRSAGSSAVRWCRPTSAPAPKSKSFPRQAMTAVSWSCSRARSGSTICASMKRPEWVCGSLTGHAEANDLTS